MSEWQAHVYCTCFPDQLITEPPLPMSRLAVNRFGVVSLTAQIDHSEDPEDLVGWREEWSEGTPGHQAPCEHPEMKVIDEIFYFPGSRSYDLPCPTVWSVIRRGSFPLLAELFVRGGGTEFPSGGIWVAADEAGVLLDEARRLWSGLPEDCDAGELDMVETLIRLLEASMLTGHPVITYYNGVIDGAW